MTGEHPARRRSRTTPRNNRKLYSDEEKLGMQATAYILEAIRSQQPRGTREHRNFAEAVSERAGKTFAHSGIQSFEKAGRPSGSGYNTIFVANEDYLATVIREFSVFPLERVRSLYQGALSTAEPLLLTALSQRQSEGRDLFDSRLRLSQLKTSDLASAEIAQLSSNYSHIATFLGLSVNDFFESVIAQAQINSQMPRFKKRSKRPVEFDSIAALTKWLIDCYAEETLLEHVSLIDSLELNRYQTQIKLLTENG